MKKQKVVVSACLLGEFCRYDGKTKEHKELIEWLKDKEVIAFCPEAPLFGTPRPKISVQSGRVFRNFDGLEVTHLLRQETLRQAQAFDGVELIILKSKSPSCDLVDGISAQIFKEKYVVLDENSYNTKKL